MHQPDTAFWKPAVADRPAGALLPLPAKRFSIARGARLASAGSCFAQHLRARLTGRETLAYLQTEPISDGQPAFSAAYGNIYTVQQMLQLFDESSQNRSIYEPPWQRKDGRLVDPFRPFMFPGGFGCEEDVRNERAFHLRAVRQLFRECDVFIFTLGLTEAWTRHDGSAVFPADPRRLNQALDNYRFHNFGLKETSDAIDDLIQKLGSLSPAIKVILTVSPVPLSATYSGEHVLLATAHSKAVLRVACSEATAKHPNVYYFPAFEVISTPFFKQQYFEQDLRSVRANGISHVMRLFDATFQSSLEPDHVPSAGSEVICDDEALIESYGFP